MATSLFLEGEFLGLIATSLLIPAIIFTWLIRKRTITRITIVFVALSLIAISCIDAILLQRLGVAAKASADAKYYALFAPEFSIALYITAGGDGRNRDQFADTRAV